MSHANARQVGGNHYVGAVQHWDIAALYELGYYEGQITKYIARHAKKNKQQDVEKALHFLEKLIELHVHGNKAPQHLDYPNLPGRDQENRNPVQAFCAQANLPSDETMVINKMCLWRNHLDLIRVRTLIQAILGGYALGGRAHEKVWFDETVDDGSHPQAQGYVNQDGPEGWGMHPDNREGV